MTSDDPQPLPAHRNRAGLRAGSVGRRFLLWTTVGFVALLGASATVEWRIEARDRAQLSANQTFLTAGAARVRYRLEGSARPGPMVVLLNGFVAPLEQWNDLQTDVAAFAPVLAYDRSGLGLSEGSTAHDAEAQAQELVRVLGTVQATAPVVLVSYSASAMFARAFAHRHPDLVAGLVFIDPDNPEQVLIPEYASRFRPGGIFRFIHVSSIFGYVTFTTLVENWLGYRRLRRSLHRTLHLRRSETPKRVEPFYGLSSHWLAAYQEARSREQSARQSLSWPDDAKMDLPLAVLSSGAEGEDLFRADAFRFHKELAAASTHGIFRNVPSWEHDSILDDPSHIPVIADLIRTILSVARGASP